MPSLLAPLETKGFLTLGFKFDATAARKLINISHRIVIFYRWNSVGKNILHSGNLMNIVNILNIQHNQVYETISVHSRSGY